MAEPILHITTASAWAAALRDGIYRTPTLDDEGFVHLSKPSQVVAVANFLCRGRTNLVLLCIDPDRLTAELRYEALTTGEPFPHLYGPLNLGPLSGLFLFRPARTAPFSFRRR